MALPGTDLAEHHMVLGMDVTVARKSPYRVSRLELNRLTWSGKFRLWLAQKRPGSGVLLNARIRTPVRSMSPKMPSAVIRESGIELCECSPYSPWGKWKPLASGSHTLEFHAVRFFSSSSFSRSIFLEDGEILIALSEPIQPDVFYAKSPSFDMWYLGIVNRELEIREVD